MAFLWLLALEGDISAYYTGASSVQVTLWKLGCARLVSVKGKISIFHCCTHTHTHTHTLVTVTLIPRRSWLPLIGQFQQSHELNFIDMGSERKFLSEFWNNYDISLSGVLFSLPVSWPGCTGGSFPQASCAWRHWAFLLLLGLALM